MKAVMASSVKKIQSEGFCPRFLRFVNRQVKVQRFASHTVVSLQEHLNQERGPVTFLASFFVRLFRSYGFHGAIVRLSKMANPLSYAAFSVSGKDLLRATTWSQDDPPHLIEKT
jgi:hypothetical protein